MIRIVNKESYHGWNIILSCTYNLLNFHDLGVKKELLNALETYFSKRKNNIVIYDENDQLINSNEYRFIQLEINFHEELIMNKNKELELYCKNQLQANDMSISEIEEINNEIDYINFSNKINTILSEINLGISTPERQSVLVDQYTIDTLMQNISFSNNTKLNTGLINCNVKILNALNTGQRVILYISNKYLCKEVKLWTKKWAYNPNVFILIEDSINFNFRMNQEKFISYSYLRNDKIHYIDSADYVNIDFVYYALTVLPFNDIYSYQNSKIKDILNELNSYNSSLYLKNETFNVKKHQ